MNAPVLSDLLNRTADSVKRPVPLPAGTGYGVIEAYNLTKSKVKQTDGIQYTVRLTRLEANDPDEQAEFDNNPDAIPVTERRFANNGTTFWLSENALFMLTDFWQALGITTEGRTFKELAPQAVGMPVVLDISKNPNKDGTGWFNNVERMSAAK